MLDIVPNHMAVTGPENRWWWDVLENGPSSRYAGYFDVDWDPPESHLRNRVLLPVLGDHYGVVLETGELRLLRDGAWFAIGYHDHRFPVSPRSLDDVLREAASRANSNELASSPTRCCACRRRPRPTASPPRAAIATRRCCRACSRS